MSLREKIQSDMIAATKSGDTVKRDALRLAISAFKYKEVETKKALEDAEVIAVIQTMLKQRRESLDQFQKANRTDLADKEIGEIATLESYLPKQMDDATLIKIVEKAIMETGATSAREMGKVMKAVLAKTAGAADGSRISALVKAMLP